MILLGKHKLSGVYQMAVIEIPTNRIGYQIKVKDSDVVLTVIARVEKENVYLMQDHFESAPTVVSGAYFVSAAQLEEMIVGLETGVWEYQL